MEINFGSSIKRNKASERSAISKITKKIEQLLPDDNNDDLQIMVTEIQCFDPDCVPIETLVILLGSNARWTQKILKPIADVTDLDIMELQIPKSWSEYESQNKQTKARELDQVQEQQELAIDWVDRIIEAIETRGVAIAHEEYLQELSRISEAIQRIQGKLSPSPDERETVTAVPIKHVTYVPMRSNRQTIPLSADSIVSRAEVARNPPLSSPPMTAIPQVASIPSKKAEKMKVVVTAENDMETVRHKKGVRQRGVWMLAIHDA